MGESFHCAFDFVQMENQKIAGTGAWRVFPCCSHLLIHSTRWNGVSWIAGLGRCA